MEKTFGWIQRTKPTFFLSLLPCFIFHIFFLSSFPFLFYFLFSFSFWFFFYFFSFFIFSFLFIFFFLFAYFVKFSFLSIIHFLLHQNLNHKTYRKPKKIKYVLLFINNALVQWWCSLIMLYYWHFVTGSKQTH